jgi:hypothetical protein
VRAATGRLVGSAAPTLTPRELLLAHTIAEHVADLLSAEPTERSLVSAAEVARELNVGRQWVYEHAAELGARRLGDGPRGRLRFDLETVRAASVCLTSKQSHSSNASAGAKSQRALKTSGRRLPNRLPQPGSILPVRPRKA